MNVLFSAIHFAAFRNYESVIAGLAERGHNVLLLADEADDLGGDRLADALTGAFPGRVCTALAPDYVELEPWFLVARKLRMGIDYLRFRQPRYDAFPKLRERAAERIPQALRWALRIPGFDTERGRGVLLSALSAIDRAMPRSREMAHVIERERPDVVLLTSVTNPRTPQLDHLRCALAMGIPSAVCVYSWDHLSSKALIRETPHRVFVWNDVQREEAVMQHALPPDRIVVTGAQCYDHWFGRAPSRSREAFASAMSLPADRLIILYVCSALTPDPRESSFVRRWLEALRRSPDAQLRAASVIIRPHPERQPEWAGIDWSDCGPLVIGGRNPLTEDAKNDYFDALFYSAAVVGLVTSAFLEAAVVGRPVLTVLPPELTAHQEGMLHFRYLLGYEGGLVTSSRSIEEHLDRLAEAVRPDWPGLARQRHFVQAFLRPQGLDVPATPTFIEQVERLASLHVEPVVAQPSRLAQSVARWLVSSRGRLVSAALRSPREEEEFQAREVRLAADRQDKARRAKLKQQYLRELEEYRAAKRAGDAARQEELIRARRARMAQKHIR